MSYALGIDIGTTYTAAAIFRDGSVETVALGSHANTIPTLAYARESGELLVGEAASARGLNDPTRLAKEFKRLLGSSTGLVLVGRLYQPEALVAAVLDAVVETASAYCGEPPTKTVVTHPAEWGEHRLETLRRAFEASSIQDVVFIAEPLAAAVFYASQERVPEGAVVAVYDLGGGTFDASVLRKAATGFELAGAPEGDGHLGGIDFDRAVLEHVATTLGDAWHHLDLTDGSVAAGMEQLRRRATEAKELLSTDLEVTIPVYLPGISRDVRLTRAEFEDRIRTDIERTLSTMQRALANADTTAEDVHTVLLVGGSSRMPLVAEVIGNGLGRPVATDAHPKLAICQGAARVAAAEASLISAPLVLDAESEPAAIAPEAALPVSTTGQITPTPGRESSSAALEADAPLPVDDPVAEPVTVIKPPVEASAPWWGWLNTNPGRLAFVSSVVILAVVIGLILRDGDSSRANEGQATVVPASPSDTPETPSPEPATPTSEPPATPTPGVAEAVGPVLPVSEADESEPGIVLFSRRRPEGNRPFDIYQIVDPTRPGTNAEDGMPVVQSDQHEALPVWSPDRRTIAFARISIDFTEWALYTAAADGSETVELDPDLAPNQRPAWGPDGERIAYVIAGLLGNELAILDLSTGERTLVTSDGLEKSDPAFSSDGQQIVFWQTPEDGSEEDRDLVFLDVETGVTTVLTLDGTWDADPRWEPEGDRIVFTRRTESDSSLYLVNSDGTGLTRLTDASRRDADPAWSPDGSAIAFNRERTTDDQLDLWFIDLTDPELTPQQITDTGTTEAHPAWASG